MTSGLYPYIKMLKHIKIKNILLVFFIILGISCTQTISSFPGTMTSVEIDEVLYWIYADKTDEMVLILAISTELTPERINVIAGQVNVKERVQPKIMKLFQPKDSRLPIVVMDGEEFPCKRNNFYIITKLNGNICTIKKEIDPSKLNEYPREDWSTNEKIIFKKARIFLD